MRENHCNTGIDVDGLARTEADHFMWLPRAAASGSTGATSDRQFPQKSLTWDRGEELTDHRRFTLATKIDVFAIRKARGSGGRTRTPIDTRAVGDGANDLGMIGHAGLGVGHHAKCR